MDEYLRKQLTKTKNVTFYNKDGEELSKDNLGDIDYLYLTLKKNIITTNKDLLFEFEDYLVNPFQGFTFHDNFNKGIAIPLTTMQGQIIKTVGKMYYLKLKGYYHKTNKCNHCLKDEYSNPICKDCFKKLNVNDIEDITWEGYVPIKGCKNITNL